MTPKNRGVQADELRWTLSTLPQSYAQRRIRWLNQHLATDYPYLFFYLQVPNAPEIHLPLPDADDEREQHYDEAPASAEEEEEDDKCMSVNMFISDEELEYLLTHPRQREENAEEEEPDHEFLEPGPDEVICLQYNTFDPANGIFTTERDFKTDELFPLDPESQKRYDDMGPIDEHPF
jgi:hypothetical protein